MYIVHWILLIIISEPFSIVQVHILNCTAQSSDIYKLYNILGNSLDSSFDSVHYFLLSCVPSKFYFYVVYMYMQ